MKEENMYCHSTFTHQIRGHFDGWSPCARPIAVKVKVIKVKVKVNR
jgi:hypothetical protein